MSQILDNPVRVARIRAGFSRAELARRLDIHRSTLVALEDGRTAAPNEENLALLREVLDAPQLGPDLISWHEQRAESIRRHLTAPQQVALHRSPGELHRFYPTFQQWRTVFSPSAMGFARLLGLNHAHVLGYERGAIARGMPEPMQHALVSRLRVTPEYLQALMALPAAPDTEES